MYKADLTIPLAFELAANEEKEDEIGKLARLKLRDKLVDGKIMQQIVKDLQYLMDISEDEEISLDIIELWDDKNENAKYGISYRE